MDGRGTSVPAALAAAQVTPEPVLEARAASPSNVPQPALAALTQRPGSRSAPAILPRCEQKPRKAEHEASIAKRRGPMDEMRQLWRILPKLICNSSHLATTKDGDDSGGNKVSEAEIRQYLGRMIGEAPDVAWGVPEGWSTCVASACRLRTVY